MDEFTKGPLTICGPSQGGTSCDDGGDYAILDQDGYAIGEAILMVDRGLSRPARANAELWAKAPRYHAALAKIANDAEHFRSAINDRNDGMMALEIIAEMADTALGPKGEDDGLL